MFRRKVILLSQENSESFAALGSELGVEGSATSRKHCSKCACQRQKRKYLESLGGAGFSTAFKN